MTKPKRQKKYLTRESVLADINAAYRKINRLKTKAGDLDEQAALFATMGNEEKCRQTRKECDRVWKQIERLETTRLLKLQRTLAAFQTVPLFGDEQVVLQKA